MDKLLAYYRKTESGKWEVEITIGINPKTGRPKKKSKRFKRKKDAQAWAAKIKTELDTGLKVDLDNYTFEEFANKFLKDYAEPNLSPTTVDGYRSIIKNHLIPYFRSIKMQDIRAMHIDSYINSKRKAGRADETDGGLSERTLLHHFRLLSKILYQAEKWEIIKNNPIKKATKPDPKKKEAKFYTREQVNKLLKAAKESDKWMYRFIIVAVNTGLRMSEMLGIQWEYVNLNKKTLTVQEVLVKVSGEGAIFKEIPKTKNSQRTIALPNKLIPIFKDIKKEQAKLRLRFGAEYYTEKNLVFCKPDGTPYYPTTVNRNFNKIKEEAGIFDVDLSIHSLRHTHASRLMELGWPAKAIQERLGHYSTEITNDIYSHVSVNFEKELVNRLDSDIGEV